MKPVGGRVTSLGDRNHKTLRFFAHVLSNIATTSEKTSGFGVRLVWGADFWLGGFELPGHANARKFKIVADFYIKCTCNVSKVRPSH